MSRLGRLTTSQLVSAIASAENLQSLAGFLDDDSCAAMKALLSRLESEKADRKKQEKASIRALKDGSS